MIAGEASLAFHCPLEILPFIPKNTTCGLQITGPGTPQAPGWLRQALPLEFHPGTETLDLYPILEVMLCLLSYLAGSQYSKKKGR